MLIYKTDRNYGVYLEEDGDDLWITVHNGYCNSYDCIVGTVEDCANVKVCVETAYRSFYPAHYINDNLNGDADRQQILSLARDAYEIDRALELALAA